MIFVLNKLFSGALNIHRFSKLVFLSKSALLAVAFSILTQAYGAPSPFLSTSGQNIRNNYGQGDIVPLRGVNLGSWLLMEGWMCPMDSSGLADNYTVVQTLNNRFGVATQESLLKTYQDAWITTNDLDNIKALGMNCVRMPFWWGNVQRLDGTWRADAFEKMDWLVTNAWKRGIYTIIDFHGVPGGQSTSDSTAQANQNQYWTSAAFKNQTSLIWSNVAAHFNGNPAVAGYDLINEPFGAPTQAAIWTAYNSLYQTIRAVDQNHIIVMEGTWSGTGTGGQQLNWQWDVLPPPTQYGWTNVIYSMHAYAGDTSSSGEKAETDKQASDFNSHQAWNVPCFIGEFNSHGTQSAWQYSVQQYDQNNMSWDNWAYKATAGSVGNSWGIYDPTGTWPPKPNIQSDSISTISNDWSQWKTSTAFGVTSFLKQYLGAPLAIADFYTNSGTLIINSNSGVLANDQDLNLGLSGISLSAVLVGNPANGQLTLNTNGSFTYTPNGGFNGIDTFRYRVFDGYVNSANIGTVSIQVGSNIPLVPAQTLVESKADGTGSVVPLLNLTAGTPTNVFAIVRDAGGTFITNASATWSLQSKTGGVVDGDLVAVGDNKSAAFTGHLIGSAVVQAVANTFTGQSGAISVNAGMVTQLIWTTLPGNATNGLPFGQQPVLQTADQSGNPTTNGLPATLNVTVVQSAGNGPLLGTTNFNIGTSGSNGVVSFTNLEINSAGTNNHLMASVLPNPPMSLLTNGNFSLPNSTATPTGWTAWSYGIGYANHEVITPAAGVKGNYDGSYQMTLGAANTTDGGGVYQIVPATAGLIFNLGIASGVQNWWWPSGEMRLFFLDAGNNGLATNVLSVTTGISWYDIGKPYQQYQLSATAPAGTTQVKVEFAGFGGGSVWFDNAVLTESNSLPALAPTTTVAFTVFAPASQTNAVFNITDNKNGTFTLNFLGTVGVTYYVQTTTNLTPPISWLALAGSTNIVTNSSGLWSCTSTNSDSKRYYRSVAAYP